MTFDLREIAKIEAGDNPGLIAVIEKELIHRDILRTMSDNGFLADLCFQGGTSLRLCYQSERFSEDLDFTGGEAFSAENIHQLKECIQDALSKKYGLQVEVKPPKPKDDGDIKVSTWQVKVVTAPQQSNIPSQKVKIEVANAPSYTREIQVVSDLYQRASAESLLVPAQSMEEVMADKLLALPASVNNIRHRDIWDLYWLSQRRVQPNLDLLSNKIRDYSVPDYHERLQARLDSLHGIIEGQQFLQQMERFLRSETIEATIKRSEYREAMFNRLHMMLDSCRDVEVRMSPRLKTR